VNAAVQEIAESPAYEFGHTLMLLSIRVAAGSFPRAVFLDLWNHPNAPAAKETIPDEVVEEIDGFFADRGPHYADPARV
jgi:hypothetical protein